MSRVSISIPHAMPLVHSQELSEREKQIQHLECQKCYLGEEIYRITGIEEGFWSDEVLVSTCDQSWGQLLLLLWVLVMMMVSQDMRDIRRR